MSTRERIRVIRLLEKIGREPVYAAMLGITAITQNSPEKKTATN